MVIVIAASVIYIAYTTRTKETEKQSYYEELCKNKAAEFDSMFRRIEATVNVLSANVSYELDSPYGLSHPSACQRYKDLIYAQVRSTVSQVPGVVQVYYRFNVAYAAGDAGLVLQYDEKKRSFEDREPTNILNYDENDFAHVGWYYAPMGMGEPTWLDPYVDENVDINMISYIVPVKKDDVILGVLGMDMPYEYLVNQLENINVPNTQYIYIKDKSGNVIGSHGEDESGNYVEFSCGLTNGMTFVLAVDKSEIQGDNRIQTGLLIGYFVVALIALFGFVGIRMDREEKNEATFHATRAVYVLAGVLFLTVLAQVAYAVYFKGSISKQATVKTQAENTYDRTIKVVANEDFAPFSYYDEDGNLQGHNIEFINEVANRMQVNVEIELTNWQQAKNTVKQRDADILLGMDSMAGSNEKLLVSSSIADDAYEVYGKQRVQGAADFIGKDIGTVRGSDVIDVYGILKKAKSYDNYIDLLDALENSEIEYAVLRKSMAQMTINKLGYTDLLQVFDMVDSQLALGFNKNDRELMDEINEVIKEMYSDGTVDDLQEKWVTRPNAVYSFKQFLLDHIAFYGSTIAVFVLCLVTIVILRIKENASIDQEELQRKSELDHLTNIYNRGAGEKKINALIEGKKPGMFCLLDADKFKDINDTYGHGVGDIVLIEIAKALKHAYRDNDVVMRLGGDEFAFYILFTYDKKAGKERIKRFFKLIDEINIPELKGKKIEVSVGATFYDGVAEENFDALYAEADACLYESKKQKGNYVTFVEDKGNEV